MKNNKKAVNLAMFVILSASLVLSAVAYSTPVLAAKHHSDKCKKSDEKCNDSQLLKTSSVSDNQTQSIGSLNATTNTGLVNIFG